MNVGDQKFVRANGSYDISGALECAARLRRRQQRVSCYLLVRAVIDTARGIRTLADVESSLVDDPKTRTR